MVKKIVLFAISVVILFANMTCTKNDNVVAPPSWDLSGKIVFDIEGNSLGGIFVLDMNSKDLSMTQVVTNGVDPQVSPDGIKLAYDAVSPQGSDDIYLISIAGGTAIDLSNRLHVHESDPAWSPDGSSIVFDAYYYPSGAICLMNRDGSNLHNLTDTSSVWSVFLPRWSPDGRSIAFVKKVAVFSGSYYHYNFSLSTIDPDGSHEVSIDQLGEEWLWYPPLWSPDSRKIAYGKSEQYYGDTLTRGLYIIDVTTLHSQKISFSNISISPINFSWLSSESIECIAYTPTDSSYEIYSVSTSPLLEKKLLADGFMTLPTIVLSPDEKNIAIIGMRRGDDGIVLYTVQTDGVNFRRRKVVDQNSSSFIDQSYISWIK